MSGPFVTRKAISSIVEAETRPGARTHRINAPIARGPTYAARVRLSRSKDPQHSADWFFQPRVPHIVRPNAEPRYPCYEDFFITGAVGRRDLGTVPTNVMSGIPCSPVVQDSDALSVDLTAETTVQRPGESGADESGT